MGQKHWRQHSHVGGNVGSNTLDETLMWEGNSGGNTLEETDSGAVLWPEHTRGDVG